VTAWTAGKKDMSGKQEPSGECLSIGQNHPKHGAKDGANLQCRTVGTPTFLTSGLPTTQDLGFRGAVGLNAH
jgi:hypothetical protein